MVRRDWMTGDLLPLIVAGLSAGSFRILDKATLHSEDRPVSFTKNVALRQTREMPFERQGET